MAFCGDEKKPKWYREKTMFYIDRYAYTKCLGFKVFWNTQWFYMYNVFYR